MASGSSEATKTTMIRGGIIQTIYSPFTVNVPENEAG